jgi:hypothetical protein
MIETWNGMIGNGTQVVTAKAQGVLALHGNELVGTVFVGTLIVVGITLAITLSLAWYFGGR